MGRPIVGLLILLAFHPQLNRAIKEVGTTPQIRLSSLRRLLATKPLVTFLEVHHALSGLIVKNTKVAVDGVNRQFDGMWGSSLTDSTAKGKPDIEAVDVSSRMSTLSEIIERLRPSRLSMMPILVARLSISNSLSKHFERLGVSAVIIRDKTGLKMNSLFGNKVPQTQENIETFCDKISSAKKVQVTDDFMVIARIESLILEAGMDDAIRRAQAYLNAGADGIMIHSRRKEPSEIFEFCSHYAKFDRKGRSLRFLPATIRLLRRSCLNMALISSSMPITCCGRPIRPW